MCRSRSHSASKSVRPEEWGRRAAAKPTAPADDGWNDDVVQDAPYYEGQIVSHGIFGAGVVSRVEGVGEDMMVTVDFHGAGRKHINPRFAPLVPVD